MKTTIALISTFVITAMLWSFNANGQGLTVEKRHYKSGYYIDFGKSKLKAKNNTAHIEGVSEVKPVSSNGITIPVNSNVETVELSMVQVQNVTVKKLKLTNKIGTKSIATSTKEKQNEISSSTIAQVNNNIPETINRDSDRDASASFSIILIIIIILVVLWLLGILFGGWGLGFLLYLLLIAALILLILYLLKMVR